MKVFISRNLTKDSAFKNILTKAGYTVLGQSLVRFSPVQFDSVPLSNWIFFYSKNAVNFFFEQANKLNWRVPTTTRFAAIGKGTATVLKQYVTVDFIGTGKPEETAAAFLKVATNESVLFPRAATSRKSIQQLLHDQIKTIDLVVYENTIVTSSHLPYSDIVVFTSPMNAAAYFESYQKLEVQKVIAIGNTTGNWLTKHDIEHIVASSPSEESMAYAVLKL